MLFDLVHSGPLLCVQTSSSAHQVHLSALVPVVTIMCQLKTSLCTIKYVADHPASYILSALVKWPQHEADHSPLSSAKIKNEWSHTSISPYIFTAGAQTVRSVLHCLALFATCENSTMAIRWAGLGWGGGWRHVGLYIKEKHHEAWKCLEDCIQREWKGNKAIGNVCLRINTWVINGISGTFKHKFAKVRSFPSPYLSVCLPVCM